ncbi:hypothetical protein [Parafrankia discariae]|uniref:hypothetical protein n=1 Tax=Parafrankia discariae TaxID=365528 RepID=UPI00037A0BD2|nr:hypothetical protein [Parafrankia discariae]
MGKLVRFTHRRRSEEPFALPVLSGSRAFFAGDPSCRPEGEHVPAPRPLFGSPDGLWVDPDGRLFIEPAPENPRAVSNRPDFDPAGRPRPATVVIHRKGGGKTGT